MATGLKSRIIYREQTKSPDEANYWEGEYKLLLKAKSIPSPFGEKNMVDTSTLEDTVETQEPGRRSASDMSVQGAYSKQNKDELIALEDEKLDICIMYGNDGKGSEGICAFFGSQSFAPDEATEDHLTGTAKISIQTVPRWIEDDYDVEVEEDANRYPTKITLTAKTT